MSLMTGLGAAAAFVGIANLGGAIWFALDPEWLPFSFCIINFVVLAGFVQIGVFG